MSGKLHSADYKRFLESLKTARKSKGVMQEDLAIKLGKKQSFVSKTERGERRIDPVELFAWFTALNSSPIDFLESEYQSWLDDHRARKQRTSKK